MAQLLNGKKVSLHLQELVRQKVPGLVQEFGRAPHLAAVLVGNDGASETYVANKVKSCESAGFISTLIRFDTDVPEEILLAQIAALNEQEDVDGILVQLPLPKHINVEKVTSAIHPEKDVDGFHPENFGKMAKNQEAFIPATPFGILKLLEYYKIPTSGKHCVVVGRSQIVGLPMAILMARDGYPGNSTVSICNSRTPNLKEMCLQGDILVVATGKPESITGDMIKPGAVVIDVGLTRIPDTSKKSGFSIKGDVHFESASILAGAITPVPGGVGPMTITALLENTYLSAKRRLSKS